MQNSALYSGRETSRRQHIASSTRSKVLVVLLVGAVISMAGGSLAWLQWAAQRSIELGYPMPSVHIMPLTSNTLLLNQSYQFSASTSGRDVTVGWDFGDQNSDVGSIVSHSYQSNGNFTVTVNVTDPTGHSITDQLNVAVLPPPPQATFDYSFDYSSTVSFDASGSTADASTSISSYNWDFGDGSTDMTTSSQEIHFYSSPGTFPVTLVVLDATGQQSQPAITNVVIP